MPSLACLPALLQGDVAAALGDAAEAASAWRPLLWWLAPPGLALAALAVATVQEPRQKSGSGGFLPLVTLSVSSMDEADGAGALGLQGGAAAAAAAGKHAPHRTLVNAPEQAAPAGGLADSIKLLLSSRSFLALTAATSFGDIASWALIGWQATYYQVSAGGAAGCINGWPGWCAEGARPGPAPARAAPAGTCLRARLPAAPAAAAHRRADLTRSWSPYQPDAEGVRAGRQRVWPAACRRHLGGRHPWWRGVGCVDQRAPGRGGCDGALLA